MATIVPSALTRAALEANGGALCAGVPYQFTVRCDGPANSFEWYATETPIGATLTFSQPTNFFTDVTASEDGIYEFTACCIGDA